VGGSIGALGVSRSKVGEALACCNALIKACTESKRSLGSLASALKSTCSTSGGKSGTCLSSEGGGLVVCCTTTSMTVPTKGQRPVSHS
jgi:hypothetical protein